MMFSGFEGKSERAVSIISNFQKGSYQARNEDAGIKDFFLVAGTHCRGTAPNAGQLNSELLHM
jgi:hypothetical protein